MITAKTGTIDFNINKTETPPYCCTFLFQFWRELSIDGALHRKYQQKLFTLSTQIHGPKNKQFAALNFIFYLFWSVCLIQRVVCHYRFSIDLHLTLSTKCYENYKSLPTRLSCFSIDLSIRFLHILNFSCFIIGSRDHLATETGHKYSAKSL